LQEMEAGAFKRARELQTGKRFAAGATLPGPESVEPPLFALPPEPLRQPFLEWLMLGANAHLAADVVREFWNAPEGWRQALRICEWRRCRDYYLQISSSTTCSRACAAALSRENKSASAKSKSKSRVLTRKTPSTFSRGRRTR
jgi:hypothetical protein